MDAEVRRVELVALIADILPGHNARLPSGPWPDLYWSKVDKDGPVIRPELGPCWLWTGYRDKDGYGRIEVNGRGRQAHHIALELEGYYMIPEVGKLQVGHLCDNPPCVRPSHLKIWTAQHDADHKVSRGRQARGERNGRAKLQQADVDEIRRLYTAGGISQRALARQFGVTHRAIQNILIGKVWQTGRDRMDELFKTGNASAAIRAEARRRELAE